LLPRNAVFGTLNLRYPYSMTMGVAPANGTIAWNNGAMSEVSGDWATVNLGANGSSTLNILRGPGAGHRLVLNTRQNSINGPLMTDRGSITVINALFLP
jgi:hypothetical protein